MLVNAVVIAGDGAGPDIGALADMRVADIGKMIGLGARLEGGLLHLDEIADMDVGAQFGARPQPCKGPDARSLADMGAFEMRKCADDIAAGKSIAATLARGRRVIERAGFTLDYLEARHAETLATIRSAKDGPVRLLVAARIGRTRLIDNVGV
jgi:hypothetical protein